MFERHNLLRVIVFAVASSHCASPLVAGAPQRRRRAKRTAARVTLHAVRRWRTVPSLIRRSPPK